MVMKKVRIIERAENDCDDDYEEVIAAKPKVRKQQVEQVEQVEQVKQQPAQRQIKPRVVYVEEIESDEEHKSRVVRYKQPNPQLDTINEQQQEPKKVKKEKKPHVANVWQVFLKNYASSNNTTYAIALNDQKCKDEYKLYKQDPQAYLKKANKPVKKMK
jgi:hypothetical protein